MALNREIDDDAQSAVVNSSDLLSSIFAHFSLQQRCMASSACRLWRSIATASQFWENIDFRLYPSLQHAQVRPHVPARSSNEILPYGILPFGTLTAQLLGLSISHPTELTGMQMARMLRKHTGVINLNLQGIQPWNVVLAVPSKLTRSAFPHCSGADREGWTF